MRAFRLPRPSVALPLAFAIAAVIALPRATTKALYHRSHVPPARPPTPPPTLPLPPPPSTTTTSSAAAANDDDDTRDWWVATDANAPVGWFNASVLYLKPHKTGSESFKRILTRVARYYNLSHDAHLDILLPAARDRVARRNLLRKRYDMLVRHAAYRANVTERRLRGWPDGRDGHPARRVLRVTTIRDPVARLISHYFSMRRFGRYVPTRGDVSARDLSEDEEISDFCEWLQGYPFSHETRYLADRAHVDAAGHARGAAAALVDQVVALYDHVVVVEQWRISLCVFGFEEGIKPEVLRARRRNWARGDDVRFDLGSVVRRPEVWDEVVRRVEFDWLLYTGMLKKFSARLERVASPALWRYCRRVGESLPGGV